MGLLNVYRLTYPNGYVREFKISSKLNVWSFLPKGIEVEFLRCETLPIPSYGEMKEFFRKPT